MEDYHKQYREIKNAYDEIKNIKLGENTVASILSPNYPPTVLNEYDFNTRIIQKLNDKAFVGDNPILQTYKDINEFIKRFREFLSPMRHFLQDGNHLRLFTDYLENKKFRNDIKRKESVPALVKKI